MQIQISDAVNQTYIVIVTLVVLLLLTIRKKSGQDIFGIRVTNEAKGFAIIAILFAHIGYFLVSDNRFLFPLSVLSGVGVNIFLFLSGFGLTLSQQKKVLTPIQFYIKRLTNLFIPLWIVLTVFLILD